MFSTIASAPWPDARPEAARWLASRYDGVRARRRRLRRASAALTQAGSSRGDAARRVVDVTVAMAVLAITAPLGVVLLAVAMVTGHPWPRERHVGRFGRVFELRGWPWMPGPAGRVAAWPVIRVLPRLAQVLAGELSLVGPRPLPEGEVRVVGHRAWRRSEARPGVVSLHWLRARTNIAFTSEVETDLEYCVAPSWTGDLALMARAGVSLLYGRGSARTETELRILDLRIDNLTMDEAVDTIVSRLAMPAGTTRVAFVNAHCANVARDDEAYRAAIAGADLVFADGIGMKLAGNLLGAPIVANVNGTDMLPRLCAAATGRRVFLLGGRPGTPEAVAAWMREHHPGVTIAGLQHGFFDEAGEADVVAAIRASRADLLLVAFGVPKQDLWVARHARACGVRVAIGVGGLFDFYAGNIPRAPQWMRELALEWVYRLYQEPRRMWRRYVVGNARFLAHVLTTRVRPAGAARGK